jgi:hypothetical protein
MGFGSLGSVASAISNPGTAVAGLAAGALASGSKINKNKAKNTEASKAAPRDEDQLKMWEGFTELLFGSPTDEFDRFDVDYYIKNNPDVRQKLKIKDPGNITDKDRERAKKYYNSAKSFDADYYLQNNTDVAESLGIDVNNMTKKDKERAKKHWSKIGQYENRAANDAVTYDPESLVAKSYQDRLAEDIDYTKQADQTFIDTLSNIKDNRNTANNDYSGTLQQLMERDLGLATSTPIMLSGPGLSGPVAFSSGTQRRAADNVTERGGIINQLANAIADNNTGFAQAQNQFANMYTPNRAENEYMSYLQNLNAAQDALRYSTPTTVSTGETTPSLLSTLGTLMSGAGGAASLMGG